MGHAIAKRSGRVPRADITVAQRRFEDFRVRMDEVPRRPPRPVGARRALEILTIYPILITSEHADRDAQHAGWNDGEPSWQDG